MKILTFYPHLIAALVGGILYLNPLWTQAQQAISARGGELYIDRYDLRTIGPIALSGEWEFYWKQLLTPDDFKKKQPEPAYFKVPAIWNDQLVNSTAISSQGYATYRLLIHKQPSDKVFSIDIPNVYTNYTLWVNGQEISTNGTVGSTAKTSKPQWKPVVRTFMAEGDTMEIVMQVSNFHHNRGGVHKKLYLGLEDTITHRREQTVIANVLLVGGLLVLGAFFISFFLIRKGDLPTFYFGAFCILWAIRSMLSNIYLVSALFEGLVWGISIRMEYITMYGSLLMGMLFFSVAFEQYSLNKTFKYILLAINYVMIALTLFLPPMYFTKLLPAYQFFIGVNLIYVTMIIIKAVIDRQKEAMFSVVSIMLGIGLFGYEVLAYALMLPVNSIFLNMGYLMVFFLNSLVLAYRFVTAYRTINKLKAEGKEFVFGRR